jgi:threonine dehydratase
MKIKFRDVQKAKENFWKFIKTTPLIKSDRLSKKYDAKIFLKREDLQPVRSYKIRWAFNLISSLSNKEKKAWVVCASAWNHAQWVAITCKELKIKWTIFMPTTTPEQKIYKTKKFWWEYIDVILQWDTFDEALAWARKFQKENKSSFVHPFDDERIIIGQATIWLEIFEQLKKKPDYIICPIGWWWLVSWLINVISEISKETKIIWVEPEWAAAMKLSLEEWKNISLDKIDTFVDWAAVKKEWDITFKTAKKYWLKVYTCPENRICSTIQEYLREDWIVVEPAWALSTDVLKEKEIQKIIKWKKVVLIISWSNFDFERLPEVKEKSLKYEWLKRYILVDFPQRPWALKEFLNFFWESEDITRFEYLKKSNKEKAPALVWIQTDEPKNFKIFFEKLNKSAIQYDDITDNSMYFDMLI